MGWAKSDAPAIDAALKEAGGLSFVKGGDRVFLKVNANSGDEYPYSTSPEMIRFLGARLRDLGAEVTVGDRSFWGDKGTLQNLHRNGIAAVAKEVSANLVVLEGPDKDWVKINPEQVPDWRGAIHLPRLVTESDHVINLPCVKTHFITGSTLSLKNVLGLVRASDRSRTGNLKTHDTRKLYRQIAQINRVITPRLNILDGHRALVAGGPTPQSGRRPRIVQTGLVVVSADRIATDVAGIAILKRHADKAERITQHATWKDPMILAAIDAGLGIGLPAQLEMRGQSVKNLKTFQRLAVEG
jgi:uncharacterized protein (DUF362 family)